MPTAEQTSLPRRACPDLSLTCVTHAPDRFRAIVDDPERPIGRGGNAHRAAPHLAIVRNKAGEKILILAAGFAVVERDTNHFVTGARGFVPRSVLGREDITVILFRKLLAGIESQL